MEIVCEQAPLLQFWPNSNLASRVSRARPGQKRKKTARDGALPYPFPQATLGLSACANSPRSIY